MARCTEDLQRIDRGGTGIAGFLRIVVELTDDVDHCSLSPKAVDLRRGRNAGNENLGLHTKYPGGAGNSDPVVAARSGNEPASRHAEAKRGVEAAAGLERAGVLKRLELQRHRLGEPKVARRRPQHGRAPNERPTPLEGGGDVGTGRHGNRGHGTLSKPFRHEGTGRKSSLCKVIATALLVDSAIVVRSAACATDPS